MSFSDFVTQATPISKVGSVAKYANIEKYPHFLTPRDPVKFPVVQNNDKHCTFDSHSGRKKVTVSEYRASVANMKPTVFTALADEVVLFSHLCAAVLTLGCAAGPGVRNSEAPHHSCVPFP